MFPNDASPKVSYAGAKLKQKATTALTPHCKHKNIMQRGQPFYIPLGTSVIHELSPK